MRRHLNRLLIRFNGWPRRVTALVCLLAAFASEVHGHVGTRTDRGAAVVVAARDLPIGTTLGPDDVRVTRWPPGLAPSQALTTAQAASGRRLSTPLAKGEPVTLTRVVGSELTAGLGADQVASTVATAADVSALVHPGDRVDLLAAPADGSETNASGLPASVVARDARVLAVLARTAEDATTGTTLIVATSRSNALVLASASGSRILAVLGRSP